MSWSTDLCSCCADPGGCGLCFRAACCPCTVTGDINSEVEVVPMGFLGGCLCGALCEPCFMMVAAPKVAEKKGKDESAGKALCCSCCPCTSCCYLQQVWREMNINSPGQMEMN